MIILGIDPGIHRTGYAFLKSDRNQTVLLECGCITTDQKKSDAKRLLEISRDLDQLIKKHQPDLACLESLFFANNQKTAIRVGQGRGAVLLTLAKHNLKTLELTPLQVKIAASGYGKADKRQVQRMMVKILNLKKIPKPDDAADAVAIAWAAIGRLV